MNTSLVTREILHGWLVGPDGDERARTDLMAATPAPRRAVRLAELRTHRGQIQAVAGRYGIFNVRVFGSVARDTATADSDLDLLVDVHPGRGHFDLAGFALDVEDLLGVFTQVATPNGLKLRVRTRILADAVPL